ncbi:MAG: hypothetical protein HC917_01110 [Richelia sp. SM2_1_7]|nr:hypothetical protein [Richelia sp. SM2_1_7]
MVCISTVWFKCEQTLVDGGIKLTSGNEAYAGFNTRTIPPLDKNEGYILSFNLQLLSEDHTSYGNTDKTEMERQTEQVLALLYSVAVAKVLN